jgi:hypothetical protein
MMTPELLSSLSDSLAASASPVERDIAALLRGDAASEAGAWRLQRYHRKIDVAHRLLSAYDERLQAAVSTTCVSPAAYLGLGMVFLDAARRSSGSTDERLRADVLRWVNSGFNCLDHADPGADAAGVEAELQRLLEGAVRA